MKKNRLALIFTFSIALFLASFILGYQLMGTKINSKDSVKAKNNNDLNNEEIEIIKEENRISPNTFIEERTHYKECDHLTTKLNVADDEIINMTRKEYESYLKSNYPNKRLISFSNTKIVVWGERNHLCQEHYIIGEENGSIAIFKVGENGEKYYIKYLMIIH